MLCCLALFIVSQLFNHVSHWNGIEDEMYSMGVSDGMKTLYNVPYVCTKHIGGYIHAHTMHASSSCKWQLLEVTLEWYERCDTHTAHSTVRHSATVGTWYPMDYPDDYTLCMW